MKCNLCELNRELNTDILSPDDGIICIPKHSDVLMLVNSNKKEEYIMTVKYCLLCGKKIRHSR